VCAAVKFVVVCVRVAWACHQSGGPGVQSAMPPALVHEDPYLDLFDSESEDVSGLGSLHSHAESDGVGRSARYLMIGFTLMSFLGPTYCWIVSWSSNLLHC